MVNQYIKENLFNFFLYISGMKRFIGFIMLVFLLVSNTGFSLTTADLNQDSVKVISDIDIVTSDVQIITLDVVLGLEYFPMALGKVVLTQLQLKAVTKSIESFESYNLLISENRKTSLRFKPIDNRHCRLARDGIRRVQPT